MHDTAPRTARPHGVGPMVAILALGLSACTEVGGPATDDGTSVVPGIIVSEPALAFDGPANAAVASGVSYASLPPGSLPLATSVRIRNRTTGGQPTSAIPVVDGGFDPVAIAAEAGHQFELTVTWATGGTRVLLATVPPRRPPSIVRTDPPRGRTDVALGVRPTVVFSEPIDPRSLSPTSLQLLQNGTAVPGSVGLETAAAWLAVFTPASLLEPATTYELVVTRDIVDLNGDPLDETVRIPFTTTEIAEPSARIAFATEVSPGNGALYIANSDGSGIRQLHAGRTYYTRPRWSPDRRHIAFSRAGPNMVTGIFVIDVDGPGSLVRLADGKDPAWSPDGSRIAFASSSGAGAWGVHVMNADGSDIRRLTSPNDPSQCSEGSSANDFKPDWSPDGRRILFERQIHTDDDGFDCGLDGWGYVPNVYLVNADGTGLRRLRTLPWTTEDMDPAWSPDGHSIAFNTISTIPRGIYIIDKDATSAARPVLAAIPGNYAVSPVWSPDGRKLLVLSVSAPNNQLVMVELESGTTQVLDFPSVPGLLLDPAWSR